ncbi:MAG TPA: galactokinase family protein [Blastocatellia bacterium]|jgi:N-acetylgalactosamine kinase|nr:galactokinase family protein [Blastocatellia bacterium]
MTEQPKLSAALQRFKELYGDGEVSVLRAPARINIIGEHVDYVPGDSMASLCFASREHAMLMLFRAPDERVDEGVVRGASMLEKFPPFSFAIDEEKIGNETPWESIVFNRPAPAPHWSNYVKGAVSFARWKHGARVARGLDFLIESSIPPNSGASSSSALVTLAGAAIREANHLKYKLKELALDSSQAEWFIGTRGGAMDHLAICLATRGNAIYISHSDRYAEPVPMPDHRYRWITFFSHEADKGNELMLEYNERVAVSRLMIPTLLQDPKAGDLPETMTLDEFERRYPEVFRECEREFPDLVRERRARPLKLSDRSKHHKQESIRVKLMARLFFADHLKDDERMREIGDALNQSHASLRDYYDVSTPEVERLVEIITADSLVYGARLMGGGFGGNILALTTAENTQALIDRAQNEFYAPRGRDGIGEGLVMVSTPGNGLEFLN